jgi:hypothetical protein
VATKRIYDQLRAECAYAVIRGVAQLDADTPTTFKEAMTSIHKSEWLEAAQKEYNTAVAMNTWKVIPRTNLPAGANVISVKWVFKRKHDASGNPTEFKARMTPHGYKQIEGVDFYETYAQVGMYKTLRVLLALVVNFDYELDQMDVPSAFLNAPLDENIYMELPEGFSQPGMVVKLLKALYGLKQGPRCWWLLISKFIINNMGYSACISDSCFFFKKSRTGKNMYLYLFVDDFQTAYHIDDVDEWFELKKLLIDEFRTKDLGASVWMLGMRITRDRVNHTLLLDQETYVTKALEKFGLNECKICLTPEQVNADVSTSIDGSLDKSVDQNEYMQIVGTLLYAVTSTRLDIAHAVQKLSSRAQSPVLRDMIAAKRVLRYLSGARSNGLKFIGTKQLNTTKSIVIEGFSDADWANDRIDRKSISGWVVKLNGTPVAWSSKKQRSVSLSTCEAELYAECETVKEILWLQGLLMELNLQFIKPSIIYCDNQSTVHISKNGIKNERTKHIDVKYNFIVDEITLGNIKSQWISTTEQQADIFTKPLSRELFIKFRSQLMMTA